MKRFFFRRVRRGFFLSVFLGVSWFAYATHQRDPLERKVGEVSTLLFGVKDNWGFQFFDSYRKGGLFSPPVPDGDPPTVPIRNNPSYDDALAKVRELKLMIEKEAELRSDLQSLDPKYSTVVEVAARYVDIQRSLYTNAIANFHEMGISTESFAVDEWNLKLPDTYGIQFVVRAELQKKFHIRHVAEDSDLRRVELIIPYYDRTQLEVMALGRLKSKREYQRLIHLMAIRDSLVNRWVIDRMAPGQVEDPVMVPPRGYESFSADRVGKLSEYAFSRDLKVQDRYEALITRPLRSLEGLLKEKPLGSPEDYRELASRAYSSISGLRNSGFDPDPVVASLITVEEGAVFESAEHVILSANLPQDPMEARSIAERTAFRVFQVRKFALRSALLGRLKVDLAFWEGWVSSDDSGMIPDPSLLKGVDLVRIPQHEISRVDSIIDQFASARSAQWIASMEQSIVEFYRALSQSGALAAGERYKLDFFKDNLRNSVDGVFALKQINSFEGVRSNLRAVPSGNASLLKSGGKNVPVEKICQQVTPVTNVCIDKVRVDQYLSGLDASADLGMEWVIPWTPGQVKSLYEQKLENYANLNPGTLDRAREGHLSYCLNLFFENLTERYQKAAFERKSELEGLRRKHALKLAQEIAKNPRILPEDSRHLWEMKKLQSRIDAIGLTSSESVLTEEIYQAAGHHAFSGCVEKVKDKIQEDYQALEAKRNQDSWQRMEEAIRRKNAIRVDKTRVDNQSVRAAEEFHRRLYPQSVADLILVGQLFSLLGFGDDFFKRYRGDGRLLGWKRTEIPFKTIDHLYAKPDSETLKLLGGALRGTARTPRGSAISEISRSALAQKFLAEFLVEQSMIQNPFLRIEKGEGRAMRTGLQLLEPHYTVGRGWNLGAASRVLESILTLAVEKDRGKLEDALRADPLNPGESEEFKRIFRSYEHTRGVIASTVFGHKLRKLRDWDHDLQRETRTTAEVWNDRVQWAAEKIAMLTLFFLCFEGLLMVLPIFGGAIPSAATLFSKIAICGISGSTFLGFLNGSNLAVQFFFLSAVATQGNVAFYAIPEQMRYQREVLNSTVGLPFDLKREISQPERVRREHVQQTERVMQQAKDVFVFGASIQGVFLPLQMKQFLRWSGSTARAALVRLGTSNPELAQAMRSYSLPEMIKIHGYKKGSTYFMDRYLTAIAAGKSVAAVNGGVVFSDAQRLFASSMASTFTDSDYFAKLLEARLINIKDQVLPGIEKAHEHFMVTQGVKPKNLERTLLGYFEKRLFNLKYQWMSPSLRLGVDRGIWESLQNGHFSSIAEGTEKNMIAAFLLLYRKKNLMEEALFLADVLRRLRSVEALGSGAAGMDVVFQEFSRPGALGIFDRLIDFAAAVPETHEIPLRINLLQDAKRISQDFKILADDIEKLTPREAAIHSAMKGEVDVVIENDLKLRLGPWNREMGSGEDFLMIPAGDLTNP